LRQKLFLHFLNHGIYIANKNVGNVSAIMGRDELERFVAVWEGFIQKLN
jgi:hypothetical protein